MSDPLRLLCVCTHNRTRSVMAAAMLDRRADEVGLSASVSSAGTVDDGGPATPDTVRMLADLGLDVSNHRSRQIDESVARRADLIVTAEHAHVVHIAGRWPDLFARTFTLPEVVERAETIGGRNGAPVGVWLGRVGEGRPVALDYLDAGDRGEVADIADPTGLSRRHWNVAFAEIDDLTTRLAKLLA